VATTRMPDAGAKVLEADILACRPPATDGMTVIPEAEAESQRNVRTTVRNSTGRPFDVVYPDADGQWRATTLTPGEVSGEFGNNRPFLTLVFPGCGASRLFLYNHPLRYPYVEARDARAWETTGGLSEGERQPVAIAGQRYVVTRKDDSAESKHFAVDVLSCSLR
jgi:hypothetical protein